MHQSTGGLQSNGFGSSTFGNSSTNNMQSNSMNESTSSQGNGFSSQNPVGGSSFSSFGTNVADHPTSNLGFSNFAQAQQTASSIGNTKSQSNLHAPKNPSLGITSLPENNALSAEVMLDPVSAFRAHRFVYGRIPEIEPPEDLR